MKQLLVHAPPRLEAGFARIRRELGVPEHFPPEVLAAAEEARPSTIERRDARSIPFVAIDPPGATDLDQAFAATVTPNGFRVHYAIADLGAFVVPGGPIDAEARARGTTLYSPDLRTPLHPPVISEDRASLLPGAERPALLWTIDLDGDGNPERSHLERATVSIREAISYAEAQRRIDAGDDLLGPLRTIGELRARRELDRGGVSLNLPAQTVTERDGSYHLEFDTSLPVEDWNAQISLLTGIVAGTMIADAKVGLLRTLPAARKQDLRALRRQARALGIDWPDAVPYADLVRSIEPTDARRAAFLLQAARSFRGAGYLAVVGELPDDHEHGAIASVYAHVTAPLRRLVDRFDNEILLALHADQAPPAWAVEALEELPGLMTKARSRESALERAILDFTESVVLSDRVGDSFRAYVIDLETSRGRARVQLVDPAVVTTIEAPDLTLGAEIELVLRAVDTTTHSLDFEVSSRS